MKYLEVKYTVKEAVVVSEHNKMAVRIDVIVNNNNNMPVKRKITALFNKIEKALPVSNHMLILDKVVAKIAAIFYQYALEHNLHNKHTDVVVRIANKLIVKLDREGILSVRYKKLTSNIVDFDLILDMIANPDPVEKKMSKIETKIKWFSKRLNERVY